MKLNVKKIETERKRLGWNNSDLARKMKVTRQYVSLYLNHPEKAGFRAVKRFAKALNIKEKDLLS